MNEAKIWSFDTFGWVDAYNADPNFIGHAMWQTHPPVDFDLSVGRRVDREPSPPPEKWRQILAVSGADFEGLMKAARMSAGLFLIQAKLAKEFLFQDDSYFDLHRMSSIIYLATATERLREFFVATAFRQSQKKYNRRGEYIDQKRSLYATPFLEAQETLARSSPEVTSALAKLFPLVTQIEALRGVRNKLIHELATAIGRRQRQAITEPRQSADSTDFDFNAFREAVRQSEEAHRKRISDTIKGLSNWYSLLARASNEAFIVEHHLRRSR